MGHKKEILDTPARNAALVVKLEAEVLRLKEVLFCCGEIAVGDFCDPIVGLVNRTLKEFKVPEARFNEILEGT